jgi:hypothetical protein
MRFTRMSRMKMGVILAAACVAAVPLSFLGIAFFGAQRADHGWNPAVATPTFTGAHPRVLLDEGHNDASSAGLAGRYWPLARLLRADGYAVWRGHAAFGAAASKLSSAFGVTMHKGFAEVPGESSDPLLFSKENGRLGDHSIVTGAQAGTSIARVMTYTGQSLDRPGAATVLLRLPPTAVEAVPEGDDLVERPAGPAQGLALEFGKGRVVVLGEGAMATAQVNRREPYGMNTGDNDNAQFMLNVMHWLSRTL